MESWTTSHLLPGSNLQAASRDRSAWEAEKKVGVDNRKMPSHSVGESLEPMGADAGGGGRLRLMLAL